MSSGKLATGLQANTLNAKMAAMPYRVSGSTQHSLSANAKSVQPYLHLFRYDSSSEEAAIDIATHSLEVQSPTWTFQELFSELKRVKTIPP